MTNKIFSVIIKIKMINFRIKKMFKFLAASLMYLLCVSGTYAGYLVQGPVKAEDCYDLGIKICSTKTVTEVRKDGRRFEIANYFEDVSSHDASRRMCWINTKSRGLGFLSLGINSLTQPEFWGYDKSGKYVKIDADNIYFKCIKQ
ncbi:hypothetical protein [Limnohabitans sp. T6-20]|uniref:hypothetical protein n=1 Tax=Limnohabitans sp. T6-20 TaxID=1100725 RepID=UPI0011B25475|nr:hypothetical protein [Limnohabitans sp. T6-20]